jgi:two-component system, sensor histidine kinase RegB
LTAATNVVYKRLQALSGISLDRLIACFFILDILSLTLILMLTGGANNPFSLLYLVQITLSATILSKRWTRTLGLLAILCFGSLFFVYVPLRGLEPHRAPQDRNVHLIGMWVGFAFAATLITIFSGKISEALRQRDSQLVFLERQLAHRERLASLATLAAGAAHELSTPLATIAVVAKDLELSSGVSGPYSALAEDSRLIRSEVERCRRILQGMSAQGADLPGELPATLSADNLVHQLQTALPQEISTRLRVELGNLRGPLKVPVQGLVQSLSALLKNAAEAAPKGDILLRVNSEDHVCQFCVVDKGCGMSDEVLARLGEPFFSTKPAGSGMGLGVFLVRALAEQWGGELTFRSTVGAGTEARLDLPLSGAMDVRSH